MDRSLVLTEKEALELAILLQSFDKGNNKEIQYWVGLLTSEGRIMKTIQEHIEDMENE